nr:integrin alpha-PS3-like [Leptinotarsa decemlineata]
MKRGRRIESGVVYNCPISKKCTAISLPNHVSYSSQHKENWEGNFIGGTMDISYKYDRMTICGFRKIYEYTRPSPDYRMMGACYWSSLNTSAFERIEPLLEYNTGIIEFRSTYIYYYGQGQAGFSAHFPMERNELILGAPGIFNWAGTPLRVSDEEDRNPDPSRRRRGTIIVEPLKKVEVPNARVNQAFDLLGNMFSDQQNNNVVVFQFANSNPIVINTTLIGHQFGEYFGASLGSGRINGDNLDDLIVGAPFYKGNSFNEGKVYCYLGGQPIVKLDVAIGAPYENEGSGAVYIYKGYKFGLSDIHSQKIYGKNIYPGLRGFGISFSRAVDIDRNKFKDVAVGAHLSGNAILLRGRPVVVIEYNFESIPATLKQDSNYFLLKICFRYSVFENETLEILFNTTVDKALGRGKIEGSNSKTVTKKLIIAEGNQSCSNVTVSLNPPENFNSSATSIPITASLYYELSNPEALKGNVSETPIMVNDYDRLCLNCPVLDIFRSNKTYYEIHIPFTLDCGEDNDCRSKLFVDMNIPELSNGKSYIVGSKPYLNLMANIKNEGENAYSTKLEIVLPDIIVFRQIGPRCRTLNSSAISCLVGDPLRENKMMSINLDLDVTNINKDLSTYELPIFGRIFTTSNNTNGDTFIYELKIKKEADITIYGKSEQKGNSFGNATTEFTHIYKIEKTGVSPIEMITVKINIPHYYITPSAKIPFLTLYNPKTTLGNQLGTCRSVFTEGIQLENIPERRKRQVEVFQNISQTNRKEDIKINDEEITIFSNTTFYLNCSTNEVLCSEVLCTIGPFDKRKLAVIEIKMLLNISTIIEAVAENLTVLFSTRGDVEIDIPKNFIQSGNRSDSFIISSIFTVNDKTTVGIAIWIIILAIIAGLLLLVLLILTLVKLGFFKRSKKQELEDLKAAQEENHEGLSDDLEECHQEELSDPYNMGSSLEGLCDENDQQQKL